MVQGGKVGSVLCRILFRLLVQLAQLRSSLELRSLHHIQGTVDLDAYRYAVSCECPHGFWERELPDLHVEGQGITTL